MKLIEKLSDFICAILESNPILDHITRLGMSDEGYVMAMMREAKRRTSR